MKASYLQHIINRANMNVVYNKPIISNKVWISIYLKVYSVISTFKLYVCDSPPTGAAQLGIYDRPVEI